MDLDAEVSDSLSGFGELPLTILGHGPMSVFLSDVFSDAAGSEEASAVSEYWEDGLDFYAGLSTLSRRVTVPDTGFEAVFWFHPELIRDAIVENAGSR